MFRWKNKGLQQGKIGSQLIKNATAYFVLVLACGATAFFGVCSPNASQTSSLSGAAARVGGAEISALEFKRVYQNMVSQYQQIYQDKFDPGKLKLAENVLQDLVNQRLVYEQARSLGFNSAKEEAEEVIYQQFKSDDGKFDPEMFKRYLRSLGYSEASLVDDVRRRATADRFRRFFGDSSYYASPFVEMDYKLAETKLDVEYLKFTSDDIKVSVTPEDVKKFQNDEGKKKIKDYYERNASEFKREKRVKASHILIAFKDARNPSGDAAKRTKDEAKAVAGKVLAEVKKAGADFAALAKKYTDEQSGKTKGGDLGFFTKEDMVKEFSDSAFGLKPGEISGVVESPFGFHIIKVTEVQEGYEKTLEQASDEIAKKLLETDKKPEVLTRRTDEVFAALKAGKNIQNLLSEYKVSWKSTGEFSAEARSIPGLGANDEMLNAVFSLKHPGDVSPSIVNADGAKLILRLKSRSNPDMQKFDAKKQADLAKGAEASYGGSLYRSLNTKYEEKMKKAGKIKLNDEFLAIDRRSTAADDGG